MTETTTELPVLSSFLGAKTVPLDEIDPFSLESLRRIQEDCFKNNEPFYVCLVPERERFFFFYGSSFLEGYLRSRRLIKNPFTKAPITDFEILVCSPGAPAAKHFMMKEFAEKTPNYCLPIATDVYRSNQERSKFLGHLGVHMLELGRIKTGLFYLEKAGRLGLVNVLLDLARHFSEGSKGFEQDTRQAVRYYQFAACMGNCVAIAQMVKCWAHGIGVPKNLAKSKGWRACLPEWIRLGEINSIITLLMKKEAWMDEMREVQIPEELMLEVPPLYSLEDERLQTWNESAAQALLGISNYMDLELGKYLSIWKKSVNEHLKANALKRWLIK